MRSLDTLREWLSARWPISEVTRLALEEEIPGGSRFSLSIGSAVLTVFAIQALTGIMQLFYYVPSVRDAYLSVGYLHTEVPFGWLIHGMHFWGAQVIIVLMFCHLARVFVWGAYKRPRELTWLAGVALLLVLMAFSLTGATLPWDQKGYWAGQVSTSVAGVVPLVGKAQKVFLRGGPEMGQLTITRFFGIHVALLPLAFIALFSLHIVAMRRFGSAGPWEEEKRTPAGPFWPDQALKDAIVAVIVFLILLTLVVFVPYQFSGPAEPFDTSYVPKPEWNFLFLYEALKFFQGPLEPLAVVGVPGLLILLLVLLPFIDRSPERDPFRRPLVLFSGVALALIITALSIAGHLSPGYGSPETGSGAVAPKNLAADDRPDVSPSPVARDTKISVSGADAGGAPALDRIYGEPGDAAYIIGNARRGWELFSNTCSGCHGEGGAAGLPNPGSARGVIPALDPLERGLYSTVPVTFAENIDRIIQHGSVPKGSPVIEMPAFGDEGTLNQQQIANLISYVMAINGEDRARIVDPGIKPETFYVIALGILLLVSLALAGGWSRRSDPRTGKNSERNGS